MLNKTNAASPIPATVAAELPHRKQPTAPRFAGATKLHKFALSKRTFCAVWGSSTLHDEADEEYPPLRRPVCADASLYILGDASF
jgi:hypothetical protein